MYNKIMKRIKSCGCIILKDDKVLLISYRDDNDRLLWSFPKGHQEAGESDFETAIRETKEEVGLDVEIINEKPIKTGHFEHGGTIYKDILLFLAKPLNSEIRLQNSEVKEARWVPVDEASKYLETYYKDAWKKYLRNMI